MSARVREQKSGISFHVRLTPKGGRDRIDGWMQDSAGAWHLKARVSAVPEKGKANESLLALLARELHIPRSSIAIDAGDKARLKTITVAGDARVLTPRLEALGEAK